MSTPQSLLQATINRLGARLGSQLADRAAELALLAREGPQRLQRELGLFWEEVELEAQRLEKGDTGKAASGAQERTAVDPQDQIDALRAKVASLALQLERATPGGGQAGPV